MRWIRARARARDRRAHPRAAARAAGRATAHLAVPSGDPCTLLDAMLDRLRDGLALPGDEAREIEKSVPGLT